MEHAEHIDLTVNYAARIEGVYERYGWVILSVSAIFSIVAAMVVTIPSYYMLTDPLYENVYPTMIAWGLTWVGFNVFALLLILIPFRRGERWAWFALWMLPLSWLSLFALAPDLPLYLLLAVVTAAGLVLPLRRFFPSPE